MYAGRPVETGTVDDSFYRPACPTPWACSVPPRLDSASASPDPRRGEPAVPGRPPAGLSLRPAGPMRLSVLPRVGARPRRHSPSRPPGPPATATPRSRSRGSTATDVFPPGGREPAGGPPAPGGRASVLGGRRPRPPLPLTRGRCSGGRSHRPRRRRHHLRHSGRAKRWASSASRSCGKTTTIKRDPDPGPVPRRAGSRLGQETKGLDRGGPARHPPQPCRSSSKDRWPPLRPPAPGGDILRGPPHLRRAQGQRSARVRELLRLVGLARNTPAVTRASSPAGSASGSASPGPWPWSRS